MLLALRAGAGGLSMHARSVCSTFAHPEVTRPPEAQHAVWYPPSVTATGRKGGRADWGGGEGQTENLAHDEHAWVGLDLVRVAHAEALERREAHWFYHGEGVVRGVGRGLSHRRRRGDVELLPQTERTSKIEVEKIRAITW